MAVDHDARLDRAAELLAMLNAKTASWHPVIAEYGALRREDIAFALSLVRSLPAQLLARIKYADQNRYIGSLEIELIAAIERGALMSVMNNCDISRWKVPYPGFIRNMCRLALFEALSPKLCSRCRGRGVIKPRKGPDRDCERCAGTGKNSNMASERRELLQISDQSWCQHWKERYSSIQALLDKFEAVALGGLAKRVR